MGALLLLVVAGPLIAFAQQPSRTQSPAPGQAPGAAGQQPATVPEPAPAVTPAPAPIPVIPEAQQIGPPSTVPSAPQRVLPSPSLDVPVTATLQLAPALTLREEWTDNFNLTRRDRQSNFRSVVSPGLALGINSPLTRGLISYTFSPSYDTLTDDVSLFHSLLGQVVWQANPRWTLTLADAFTRSDEPGEADRLGLRQQRGSFTANTLSLTSDYRFGTVATRQSYRFVIFSDDDGEETTTHNIGADVALPLFQPNLLSLGYDYLSTVSSGGSDSGQQVFASTSEDFRVQGHRLTAALSRQVSPRSTLGLKTSYALRNVDETETDDSDYQLWNASVFAKYLLPGRLILDGSLGVTGVTGAEDAGPRVFTSTRLSYEFARAVVSLAADRGFSETFGEGQNFGLVETAGASASFTYRFTPLMSGTASGFYRRNKGTGIGNLDEEEDTENWGGTVVLSWHLLRNLLLNLSYTYLEQAGTDGRSTAAGGDNGYTENRVQAALRISF